ncbi:hypothetical protein J2Y69_001774 [Microbacterium resistens]|uniref:Alpha-tubulin suppressor n=1 Tax=Microbacterium resistens TaxID=156977 RepID=A0ABU1SC32_9MICO|nr:hypothetical protein [Microbacterium resistens]MDR6867175.1 hypothetical protein [Microbacterium resistens]
MNDVTIPDGQGAVEGHRQQGETGRVHRRTIVKGAAWSVPVIATMVALPAAAASVSPLVTIEVTPNGVTNKLNDVLVTREIDTTVTVKLADGSPDTSLKTVTVTLGPGLKFADDTSTYVYSGTGSSFQIPTTNRVTGEFAGPSTITAVVTSAPTVPSTTLPITVSPGSFYSLGRHDAFFGNEKATGIVGPSENQFRINQPAVFDSFYPVIVRSGQTVAHLSQGGWTAQGFAVTTDGALLGWGRNVNYELGTGDDVPHPALSPLEVLPAGSVAQAESMEDGIIILKTDGSVLSSTGSVRFPEGQGGNGGVATTSPTPVLTAPGVPLGSNIVKVATGPTNGYALDADGAVWSWGHGVAGGNGDGSNDDNKYASPVTFPAGVTIVDIAAAGVDINGAASVKAVDSDGNVWTWGRGDRNLSGMNAGSTPTPTIIPGLSGVQKIWGDFTGFAAKTASGDVYVWGDANVEGAQNMLGLNGASAATPTLVPELAGADRVVFSQFSGAAKFPDGTVKTWGNSENGTPGPIAVPTTLEGFSNVTDIGTYRWGLYVKGDYVSPIPVPTRDRGIV